MVGEGAAWKNLQSVCNPSLLVGGEWGSQGSQQNVQQRLQEDEVTRGLLVELLRLAMSLMAWEEAHGLENYASPFSLYSEAYPMLVKCGLPR